MVSATPSRATSSTTALPCAGQLAVCASQRGSNRRPSQRPRARQKTDRASHMPSFHRHPPPSPRPRPPPSGRGVYAPRDAGDGVQKGRPQRAAGNGLPPDLRPQWPPKLTPSPSLPSPPPPQSDVSLGGRYRPPVGVIVSAGDGGPRTRDDPPHSAPDAAPGASRAAPKRRPSLTLAPPNSRPPFPHHRTRKSPASRWRGCGRFWPAKVRVGGRESRAPMCRSRRARGCRLLTRSSPLSPLASSHTCDLDSSTHTEGRDSDARRRGETRAPPLLTTLRPTAPTPLFFPHAGVTLPVGFSVRLRIRKDGASKGTNDVVSRVWWWACGVKARV